MTRSTFSPARTKHEVDIKSANQESLQAPQERPPRIMTETQAEEQDPLSSFAGASDGWRIMTPCTGFSPSDVVSKILVWLNVRPDKAGFTRDELEASQGSVLR